MLQTCQIEGLISIVSNLGRRELIDQFTHYRASFPVDFTAEFLNTMPIDRLRHIFVAMCLQSQRVPDFIRPAA